MIYFDNASTTWPKPWEVYTEMERCIKEYGVNAGRGQYKAAAKAGAILKDTRDSIKDLLHCNANYETVFTSSATEALNTILQGIDFSKIKTVYITHFEHNSVLRTLFYLQKKYNFDIIKMNMSKTSPEFDLASIKSQFANRSPDLIVLTHASNVCGLVAPVDDICGLAQKCNAITVLDMSQTAGLIDTNITELGISAAVFAGHKTLYAPFGAAGFVIKNNLPLKPLLYGGTGLQSSSLEMPGGIPERYEAGSKNIQAIAGLHSSLEWLRKIGIKTIYDKELALKQELIELLSEFKNIKIVGGNPGIGIVSCVFDGYAPDNIGQVLDDKFDIAVRTGLHCAPDAHKFLGTYPAGTVRFSLGYSNDKSDILRLGEALKYIADNG